MSKKLEKLVQLLHEFDTGMLVTRTAFGHITARPMTLQDPRPDRALWLVSYEDTSSVENIKNSSHVNLSFRRSSDQAWASIAATAVLNRNREQIDNLWQDSWSIWLKGDEQRTRESIVLIELEPYQIDFWEPEKGKLGQLFELAKAQFTDSTPALSPVRTLHISDALLAPAMKEGEK